ncbi:ADP-ribose glycohydrolase MACROD1-like [Lethenteron reissneri]|uniref:ADP-ribose glycohydrolase MACROD1-like n=1 Tax=Lethenteron reissneri TaxID=7753 RepID=UPI002AB69626|nr:ADP-ribose glycohydrolase MACROD1-like [Lethenteron reissneri]
MNCANSTLLGGGGVDGCIHRSAGSLLKEECRSLGGCSTGKAKITCGYRLPSKYVIHTVGPRVLDSVPTPEERKQLDGCYSECLHIVEDKELRSVAFPCISTGIYGFPNEPAARIALETTRNWLEKYHSKVDRIIFCLFLPIDVELYDTLMPVYFPRAPKGKGAGGVSDRQGASSQGSSPWRLASGRVTPKQPGGVFGPSSILSLLSPLSLKLPFFAAAAVASVQAVEQR